MLISEIIQRVQSLYSRGVESNTSRLTDRHIYNKMLSIRTILLTQKSKKRQKINQWNYQTIPCLELIEADIHECPCLAPVGCTYFRSKNKLPKPLTGIDRHLIQSVSSLEGDILFSEIGWSEKKYKASSKYTATKPDYFIKNEYLFITISNKNISALILEGLDKQYIPKVISVTGVFEDPLAVLEYESYCESTDTDCTSMLEKEFPLDYDLIDTLIELSVKELVILFSQGIEDKTADGFDAPTSKSK